MTGQKKHRLISDKLLWYFAITYLGNGFACAQYNIMAQPLQYYFLKGLHWKPDVVASYMALFMIPWVMKPLFGIVCDFLPLFGYRRKSYLILANVTAAIAFMLATLAPTPPYVVASILVTAVCMSMSTAIYIGLAVQSDRGGNKNRLYFSVQQICYYSASILAALVGGKICQTCEPFKAFDYCAFLAVLPSTVVAILTMILVKEEKSQLNKELFEKTKTSFKRAFNTKQLWFIAAFSFLWSFYPTYGTPLYVFESETLKFSQDIIGQLAGWNAAGMLLGAISYNLVTRNMPPKVEALTVMITCSIAASSWLFLSTPETGAILELIRGMANNWVILSIYCLASRVCPKGTEVSIMALMVSFRNLATSSANHVGGFLFVKMFNEQIAPLAVITAIMPILSLLLIPFIPDHKKESEEPD
ncbi:MAG: MFS transporter [Candidatus Melainabacteria bacterium]|nr:MAG: MFS transporter [Candidatus Melainabacteria bacterium]